MGALTTSTRRVRHSSFPVQSDDMWEYIRVTARHDSREVRIRIAAGSGETMKIALPALTPSEARRLAASLIDAADVSEGPRP